MRSLGVPGRLMGLLLYPKPAVSPWKRAGLARPHGPYRHKTDPDPRLLAGLVGVRWGDHQGRITASNARARSAISPTDSS